MLIFKRPFTDPYLNIAAEEYFVKHSSEDMCMIWVNEPSVIIGKHQNAFAEINYPYVRAENIPLIRRISGGGAVYHDSGNLNFTFIKKTEKTNQVDFSRFTSVIVAFFKSFGLEINVSKRNSLFIGNRKFSGHAEHIFHERVLHHGTILFNTNLEALQNSLNPGINYAGKAMASVRDEVLNIASLLPYNMDINQFSEKLVTWLRAYYPESNAYEMNQDELKAIHQLAETKYKTWQWNFGYSPAYSFSVRIPLLSGTSSAAAKVENGRFVQIDQPSGNNDLQLTEILQSMIGLLHNEDEIRLFVEKNIKTLELAGVNSVYYTESFFK